MGANDSTVGTNNNNKSALRLNVAIYTIFPPLNRDTQGHKLCYMQL